MGSSSEYAPKWDLGFGKTSWICCKPCQFQGTFPVSRKVTTRSVIVAMRPFSRQICSSGASRVGSSRTSMSGTKEHIAIDSWSQAFLSVQIHIASPFFSYNQWLLIFRYLHYLDFVLIVHECQLPRDNWFVASFISRDPHFCWEWMFHESLLSPFDGQHPFSQTNVRSSWLLQP